MKYEIIKGSEKDFEGAPDWCRQVIESIGGTRHGFVDEFDYMCRYQGKELGDDGRVSNPTTWKVIAERRPITEPLAICKTCGTDHSDNGGKCRGLFISNSAPVWDGDGLPPVGVKCEFSSYSLPDSWNSGIVRYLSEYTIVIEFTDLVNGKAESISHPRTMKFRAARSPEDVARDEFGAAVVGYLDVRPNGVRMSELYDAIAAGKIPGVKLK